jgi:hypothetical protein
MAAEDGDHGILGDIGLPQNCADAPTPRRIRRREHFSVVPLVPGS